MYIYNVLDIFIYLPYLIIWSHPPMKSTVFCSATHAVKPLSCPKNQTDAALINPKHQPFPCPLEGWNVDVKVSFHGAAACKRFIAKFHSKVIQSQMREGALCNLSTIVVARWFATQKANRSWTQLPVLPPSALDSFFFQCGYCFRQPSKPIMLKILKIIPCSHAMVPIVSKLNLYILNPSIVPVKAIIPDMQLLCNRPSTQITFRNFLSGIHCKRICWFRPLAHASENHHISKDRNQKVLAEDWAPLRSTCPRVRTRAGPKASQPMCSRRTICPRQG